jgi:hypothetical protein
MARYFIYDCFGNVAGNINGYATYKAADIQANMRGVKRSSKAFKQIWNAFNIHCDALDKQGAPASGRLIYRIELIK